MAILLLGLGVGLVALCIWLTVRIVNRKERWAKRALTALLVGTPVLYVASFVLAFWSVDRGWIADRPVAAAYRPIVALISRSKIADDVAVGLGSLGGSDPIFTIIRLEDAAGLPQHRPAFWPAEDQHDVPYRSDAR